MLTPGSAERRWGAWENRRTVAALGEQLRELYKSHSRYEFNLER